MIPRISKFDDIRPYYEEEISAAMQRIANSDVFHSLLLTFILQRH